MTTTVTNFDQVGTPRIGAVIRGQCPATSMAYHESGEVLYVTSQEDSKLRVIDCLKRNAATSEPPALRFETDGIELVESTHDKKCLLYSTSKRNSNNIQYLSVHDNKVLGCFSNHTAKITDVSLSPIDDNFLSCSHDRTVQQWNLRQKRVPVANMTVPSDQGMDPHGVPHASYDSTGLVFGITAPLVNNSGHLIHLYDARNFGNGAFADFKVQQSSIQNVIYNKVSSTELASKLSMAKWTGMEFSTSGKKLLITTNQGVALVVDGYDGTVNHAFVSDTPTAPLAACYTQDDTTVLCGGNQNGTIPCYNATTGVMLQTLQGHVGPVGCIATNPKYAQIASACTNTAIWLW